MNADEVTWLDLRSRPPFEESHGSLRWIGDGLEVIGRLEPVDPALDVEYVALRLIDQDGEPVLLVDTTGAAIAAGAVSWEVVIDGDTVLTEPATPDRVLSIALDEARLDDEFTVTIRTIAADGVPIQSTPDLPLLVSS